MTTERRTDASESGGGQTVTRRRLLRGAATAGVAASIPAVAGGAAAQEETTAGSPTEASDTDDPAEPITAEAALPTDAPTFDQSDYTGLFLQVTGYDREADGSGVGECGFAESGEEISAFDARIFETTGERPTEEVNIFAPTQGTTIESGLVFVINSQEECSSDYVTVGLEEVEASSIGTPTPAQATTSGGAIPGFDAVAGVLGVTAASVAAALRLRGSDE